MAVKSCPICNKTFPNKQALKAHSLAVHFSATNRRPINPNANAVVMAGGGANRIVRRDEYQPKNAASVAQWRFPELLVSKLGRTPSGRAWALNAALHPCGKGELQSPLLGDLQGMPDTMTGAVVTPTYNGENYINFDTTMFPTGALPTPTDLTGTWGIDVVVPPTPEIDYMYRLLYDATKTVSDWRVVRMPNMQLPPKDASVTVADDSYAVATRGVTFAGLGYGKVRSIGIGHTFELDASATNNQGRVVAAQIEGQWTTLDVNVGSPSFSTDSFTLAAGGNANAVTNISGASNLFATKLQVLSIPVDPAVLVSACPSSYQADAKFGAYTVTKFASPLLGYQFKPSGDNFSYEIDPEANTTEAKSPLGMPATAFGIVTAGYNTTSPTFNQLESFVSDSSYASGDLALPISGNTTVEGNVIHPWVSQPSDMMTSVVMFRNLTLGTNNSISSNAVVHVKSRNYFECVPNAANPATTPFTHSPAQYDYAALDAVITVGKQLADSYPASANDLGEMLGTIWDGVKEIAGPIATEVGKMGIPVVSGIAGEIGKSIHTNSDALNSKMQQLRHIANNTHVQTLMGRMRQ